MKRFSILCLLLGITLTSQAQNWAHAQEALVPGNAAASATRSDVEELLARGQKAAQDKHLDEWQASLEEALTVANAGEDKAAQALVHRELGGYYKTTGAPEKAQIAYQAALAIYQGLGDKQAEAAVQVEIGLIAIEKTEFQLALQSFQASLNLQTPVTDKKLYAKAMFGMGQAYQSTWQKELAKVWYEKALAMQREIGDKAGQANTLIGAGAYWNNTPQNQNALTAYLEARALFHSVKDIEGEARALLFIGSHYWLTDNGPKGIEFFKEAIELYKTIDDEAGQAIALNNIGAAYWGMGQMEKAREYLLKALPMQRKRADALTSVQSALVNLAFVESALGEIDSAIGRLREAVEIVEAYRKSLGGMTQAKIASQTVNSSSYYKLIGLLGRIDKSEELFDVAQKVKARTLVDLMANGSVDLTGRMSPQEKEHELQLKKQLADYNQQLIVLDGSSAFPEKRSGEIRRHITETEQQLQFFTDELSVKYPDLSRQRLSQLATPQDIASFLPADTALLEYVSKPSNVYTGEQENHLLCLTVEGGKAIVKAYPIKATSKKLSGLAMEFREMCSFPFTEVDEEAQNLYNILIAPAADQIKGKKRLIVCPDGPLWSVPFHALMFKEGQKTKFLIDNFEIAYSYSATTARMTVQKERATPGTQALKKLLVLANPQFKVPNSTPKATVKNKPSPAASAKTPKKPSAPAAKGANGSSIYDGIEALPGTQWEADALRKLFPDAVVMTGNLAQENTLKQQAAKFRNLHLATHGYFNNESPLMSGIILARPQGGQEDGLLTAREIFSLHLPTDMIVLSACETGRGQQHYNEGVVGLTWALFAAGASTQVVSQWAVADSSTATLMKTFYTNLHNGQPKGAALRSAMLSMKQSKLNHPFYWAPFILIGDWGKADLS